MAPHILAAMPLRRLLLLASIAGLCVVAPACPAPDDAQADAATPAATPAPRPTELSVHRVRVGPGDTFGAIAHGMGLSLSTQAAVIAASEPHLDLVRGIRPGDLLAFHRRPADGEGKITRVTVQRKADRRVALVPGADGSWSGRLEEPEFEVTTTRLDGTIEPGEGLWMAAPRIGLDPATVQTLIGIFDWQIDFFRLQPGDRFRVVLEQRFLDGEFRSWGTILSARFQRGDKEAFAIRFTPPGASPGYYDLEGGSNKRMFLASPVDYARISSRFTRKRWHPVLKRYRAHRGTDYAAPTGTEVRAVGDGVVRFSGRKGGYGNHVRLQHRKPYASSYSHLSRILVKNGQQVEQGQLIGKVGSTGLSTGPHLHFEFYIGSEQVDWQRQEFPAAEPLVDAVKPLYWPVRDAARGRLVGEDFPLAVREPQAAGER
jgi:murein DD-endopeptidase MepM/ murein hydrolase activator NlpD